MSESKRESEARKEEKQTQGGVSESTTASGENITGSTVTGKSVRDRTGAIYLPASCYFLSLPGLTSHLGVITAPPFWAVLPGSSRWGAGEARASGSQVKSAMGSGAARCLLHGPGGALPACALIPEADKKVGSGDEGSLVVGT